MREFYWSFVIALLSVFVEDIYDENVRTTEFAEGQKIRMDH
jgi:hypothetical protein